MTKFSLIQLNTGCDPKKSFEVLKKFIVKAASGGSKFICTPETTNIMEVRNSLLFKKIYSIKKETSKVEKYKIRWLNHLTDLPNFPTIFIANEFFDALPIKQFIKKKNKWYERNIKYSKSSKAKILDLLTTVNKLETKVGFKISSGQKFIEFSPLSLKYLKYISKSIKLNNGGLLIIDYGYLDKQMKNTLKSISKFMMPL